MRKSYQRLLCLFYSCCLVSTVQSWQPRSKIGESKCASSLFRRSPFPLRRGQGSVESLGVKQQRSTSLAMGFFSTLSDFLKSRAGDFVTLDSMDDKYGPGPLLLMVNVPPSIADYEIQDMIHDGAPMAHQAGCTLYRIDLSSSPTSMEVPALDLTLAEALDRIAQGTFSTDKEASRQVSQVEATTTNKLVSTPVLFFSGFRNQEMMAVYNILGQEIYQETGGTLTPACAKAVPKAMKKPLRQVLEEITGDHTDAIRLDSTPTE